MNKYLFLICLICSCAFHGTASGKAKKTVDESRHVMERFAQNAKLPVSLKMTLSKTDDGRDRYTTAVKNGRLHINASSGVALCRAFYSFIKQQGAGICSWSGNRLEWTSAGTDKAEHETVSPFQHHYYLNVVTYGYSMPYWDWDRWQQEIDWMALHGIDMPLALVANEAISARVWKKLGLTDEEINGYFVGPAHLPWMRMGNLSGIDGPLPDTWHKEQIALQHRILERMRTLGMKPICPAFAGFVPQAMKRVFPTANLVETSWAGAFHNWMLSPDQPLFKRIGQLFIEEWEREFGLCNYYLADSFNEMEIPFPPKGTPQRYTQLADYGESVYSAIHAGNPDATWVMQGWMFGYQRNIWDYETLQALVSRVPDDKMILLDLAEDYNYRFWRNGSNWDHYKGFMGKQWVYSVIPNMGGKSGLTGDLEFYANGGRLDVLKSPDKGCLVGFGMAPEGIENNEVIYELLCDAGWTDQRINLDDWLHNYALCRYGSTHKALPAFWQKLRQSVYGSFTDHPRYNWQFRPGLVKKGSIKANALFYEAIDTLLTAADHLGNSPLFKADLSEMVAQYAGGKLEILAQAALQAYFWGNTQSADSLAGLFTDLATQTDRLLARHPTMNLQRWLNWARNSGKNESEKRYYEKNARRIVTIWGPPVDDYSARIWSGLIRDYYLPRWKHYFAQQKNKTDFNLPQWERQWVEQTGGLSAVEPYKDQIEACKQVWKLARSINAYEAKHEEAGVWTPALVTNDWKEISWNIPVDKLKGLQGVRFNYLRGQNRLMIKEVILEADGTEVCRIKQDGETGLTNRNNDYRLSVPASVQGNNGCRLRAIVKSDGPHDSYGQVLLIYQDK